MSALGGRLVHHDSCRYIMSTFEDVQYTGDIIIIDDTSFDEYADQKTIFPLVRGRVEALDSFLCFSVLLSFIKRLHKAWRQYDIPNRYFH